MLSKVKVFLGGSMAGEGSFSTVAVAAAAERVLRELRRVLMVVIDLLMVQIMLLLH